MSSTLMSSIVQTTDRAGLGVSVVSFNPAGEPHAAALVDAVLAHYPRITGRSAPARQDLGALAGTKVTLVCQAENGFGAVVIKAQEGTVFPATASSGTAVADGLVLRPRGSRTRGIRVAFDDIVDVAPGYGHIPAMRDRIAQARAQLPRLEPLTRQHLEALPRPEAIDELAGNDNPVPIGLAVMGTWHLSPISSPAAIWLVHSYDPGADIADGYLLVNAGHGDSEHGSIYGHQLLRFGGRITTPPALTFAGALTLGDLPQEQWLARFTTR